jgi:tetratricopeptide (TPR) repeat protein
MSPDLSPEWLRLRRSLQAADGFALYVVFTDAPTQNRLGLTYLTDALKLRTQRLLEVRPDAPERLVGDTLAALFNQSGSAQPVWVEGWREATNADWNAARRQLLARLNEGRGRLESVFAAPLILLLPYESAAVTAEAAPDLWSVRRRTLYLRHPEPEADERQAADTPTHAVPPELIARAQRRMDAWNRQWNMYSYDPQADISLDDAFDAFDAASESGRTQDAQGVARQALQLAYERVEAHNDEPGHASWRDLSISLNNVGQVSRDLGDLEAARAAYAESLDLRRQLRSALGDTPQALRDLSISLNNVGQVSRDLGDLEAARAAYAESLDLSRQLRSALGDTPGVLQDLAQALGNWGGVLQAHGETEAAWEAFAEGAALARRLVAYQPTRSAYQALLDTFTSLLGT